MSESGVPGSVPFVPVSERMRAVLGTMAQAARGDYRRGMVDVLEALGFDVDADAGSVEVGEDAAGLAAEMVEAMVRAVSGPSGDGREG